MTGRRCPRGASWQRRPVGPFLVPVPTRRPGSDPGRRRVAVLVALALVATLVLGARLLQMQVIDGRANARAAEGLNTRTVVVPAQRGRILASDGSVLVGNASTTTLTVDPGQLRRSGDGGRALLVRVARVIARTPQALLARTRACGSAGAAPAPVCFSGQPVEPIPIASNVPQDKVNALLERPEAYPGIAVQSAATRTYGASPGDIAHLAGYLTQVSSDDMTRAREAGHAAPAPSALLGRAGLEKQYDAVLRGTDGRRVIGVGPDGQARQQVSATAPVAGRDVLTTIDPALQHRAATALADGLAAARKRGLRADAGSVVVLDAGTGDLIASTNQPTYDPSVWNGGITQDEYTSLFSARSDDPLSDRASAVAGPPASTFKAFSLLAAARAGVDPEGTYDCPSALMIGNRSYSNFESAAHGRISIPEALEVSCDTIFYRWAYQQWQAAGGMQAPGRAADPYAQVARAFGFGTRSGVDLPGESPGSIPDRATKRRRWEASKATSCARAERGYPEIADKARATYLEQVARENCRSGYVLRAGDAVNFAIGQGEVAATPLQVAAAYAALADDGTLRSPRIVTASEGRQGRAAMPAARTRQVVLDPAMMAVEREGLRRVVRDGTASAAFAGFDLDACPVSGKTGTAEVYGEQPTSWFASFGDRMDSGRRYVVVVRVEQGGEGGRTAAPIARAVWDAIVQREAARGARP